MFHNYFLSNIIKKLKYYITLDLDLTLFTYEIIYIQENELCYI